MGQLDKLLQEIAAGRTQPVYLVSGDMVLAEPEAIRIAEALAQKSGCPTERQRRPPDLQALFADLRTYSLFATAKVILALDSAIFADQRAAADLIDQAAEWLPLTPAAPGTVPALSAAQREAASRLLQALTVFGLDPQKQTPAALLKGLPDWAFEGGQAQRKNSPRGRGKKAAEALREALLPLLQAALENGMQGFAEGDLAQLGAILQRGLPPGHALVLAESLVAANHPLVQQLAQLGAWVDVGRVEVGQDGSWLGLQSLATQLAAETGVEIAPEALSELARRTLRQTGDFKHKQVEADSTARFAAEYRKLANLSGAKIERQLVEQVVEDRGEEDVWQILDAIGQGKTESALARYRRLLAGAEDPIAVRLGFFALLAGFCRQLTAVGSMIERARVPAKVRSYPQFKSRWASALQAELPHGKNPLAGLHPYRLHRAYLAASGIPRNDLLAFPFWVLETEMQIKGESSDPDTAVAHLIARLAAVVRN